MDDDRKQVEDPESDEDVWCPHTVCQDRVHGDPMHSDERGLPFLNEPSDPYSWVGGGGE